MRSIGRAIVTKKHGEKHNRLFDVILRVSEALLCFHASGASLLRSTTRAIVPKKRAEKHNGLVDVFLRFSEALLCFHASGASFLRSITRAIVSENMGKSIIDFLTSF